MRADYFGVSSEKDQNVNDFLLQPDLVKKRPPYENLIPLCGLLHSL